VLDQPSRAGRAVAEHRVRVDAGDGAVDDCKRDVEPGRPAEVIARTVTDRGDQDPLDAVGDHVLDHLALELQIGAGIAKDQAVPGAARDVLGSPDDQVKNGFATSGTISASVPVRRADSPRASRLGT
jgi:hypothetical protein